MVTVLRCYSLTVLVVGCCGHCYSRKLIANAIVAVVGCYGYDYGKRTLINFVNSNIIKTNAGWCKPSNSSCFARTLIGEHIGLQLCNFYVTVS